MSEHPVYAVVGHPNKGKSSVVAALTQNDAVEISPVSGTTHVAQRFALRLDGEIMLELVDTPGFQRPASCLEWLNRQEVSADQKAARVRAFINHFQGTGTFNDEVELLQPVMDGAGIIYVVDGSLPYSAEYEAEMEILRWTGQPRLAIINPIGGEDFVDEWASALNQFFSLVRLFNPLQASFEQHRELLQTFAQLSPGQRQHLARAAAALEKHRNNKLAQGARIVTELLYSLLTFSISRPLLVSENAAVKALLPGEVEQFNKKLNAIEQSHRREIEMLFGHHQVNSAISHLQVAHGELMDLEQWSLWGLEKRQLVLASAGAGAAIGLVGDAAVGGHSLMTGTLAGGVIGGLSGWLGTDRLRDKLPKALQLGARKHVLGPVKDPNFVFVVLGRSLAHARAMLNRSHARRDAHKVAINADTVVQDLGTREQVRILKLSRQLRRQGLGGDAARALERWIEEQLGQPLAGDAGVARPANPAGR